MHKTNGFSLIEIIIVILVLGILAVIPFIQWPGNVVNIEAEAQQFASYVRYTQSLSLSKTDRYRVVKSSNTTYQVLNGAGTAIILPTGKTTMTLQSGLSFGQWVNLPNNVIVFDGKGTPYLDTAIPGTPLSSGTSYSVTLTGDGNTKTINITPTTGRVSLQ